MWYECLEKNIFLKSLYTIVPDLRDVKIKEISLEREGEQLRIIFDLPVFPDILPKKWKGNGYNTVCIEVDFWVIKSLQIEYTGSQMNSNIDIELNDEIIYVSIYGNIKCSFNAEVALIQKIIPYIVK